MSNKIQLCSCKTLNSRAFLLHLEKPAGFSRPKDKRGPRRGSFPKRWASDTAVGLGGHYPSPPRDGGACLEDLAWERLCMGGQGASHGIPRSRVHPGRGQTRRHGGTWPAASIRQSPRRAQAAHSHAQVGTTRRPWRTAHTHHVVVLTWGRGPRPRKRHSPRLRTASHQVQQVTERDPAHLRVGPAQTPEKWARGWPPRTGRTEGSAWTAERRACWGP